MADFNRQRTGLALIQEACGIMGLPVPISAAANPTDVTARQMLALLTYAGRRLCKPTDGHRWQVLTRLWHLDTVPGQTLYDLPEDFDSFEDLTGWNYTSRLPMLGPASDPQWQCLKARNLGSSTISVIYRTYAGQFEIYNSFSDPQALRINYTSRAWVQDETDPLILRDHIEHDGDLILFDADLMLSLLKLQFLTQKGFDTTTAMADFKDALESAINADQDAPVLRTSLQDTYPLISTQFNVPDTGYGS